MNKITKLYLVLFDVAVPLVVLVLVLDTIDSYSAACTRKIHLDLFLVQLCSRWHGPVNTATKPNLFSGTR